MAEKKHFMGTPLTRKNYRQGMVVGAMDEQAGRFRYAMRLVSRSVNRPLSAILAIAAARSASQSFENMSIDEVEALLIRKVLRRCDGNISQAAESLGLSRAALYRRIEKYGI